MQLTNNRNILTSKSKDGAGVVGLDGSLVTSPKPMEGAGVADLGGLPEEFLKPGKSLSSAQSLLDCVTVVAAARGTDTVAMEAWMDRLPASLAALKW